jgi:LysM repeat protein
MVMRLRMLLIVSVGLNLLLAIAFFAPRHGGAGGTANAAEVSASSGDSTNGKPKVVLRRQFFSWDELESTNYQAYIKNLRDIGCPESTIRDIIIADVNQAFANRKQAEVLTAQQQWWRATPDPAAAEKLNALEQERRDTLTRLLGTNWDGSNPNNPTNAPQKVVALDGPVLGDLPEDTQKAVQEIALRTQQQTADLVNAAQQQGAQPDAAQLAQIREQTRRDLAKVLSPAQLEEFLLRYSQTAATLRNEMKSLDLSPDEFRNVFRTTDSIERQIQSLPADSPNADQQRADLLRQRDQAVRTILGEDRFKAFLAARDPSFADALAVTQQAGAPPTTVSNVYQINQAAAEERTLIQNDPTLSDEERAAKLADVDQQKGQARDQVLGLAPPPVAPAPTPPSPPPVVHSFNGGETLDQIAAHYGTTTPAILAANPDLNPNVMRRGQQIVIPPVPPPPPLPPTRPPLPPGILPTPP